MLVKVQDENYCPHTFPLILAEAFFPESNIIMLLFLHSEHWNISLFEKKNTSTLAAKVCGLGVSSCCVNILHNKSYARVSRSGV